jgi:hypothetical protein
MWLLGLAISGAAAIIGFTQARAFVTNRLRYVDAAQSPVAPVLAAGGALLVGSLAAGLLPIVGGGTALAFAVSVGLGVASGQRDVRRALPPGT